MKLLALAIATLMFSSSVVVADDTTKTTPVASPQTTTARLGTIWNFDKFSEFTTRYKNPEGYVSETMPNSLWDSVESTVTPEALSLAGSLGYDLAVVTQASGYYGIWAVRDTTTYGVTDDPKLEEVSKLQDANRAR